VRLLLKDFQDEYVGQLLDEIRAARSDAGRRPQAVTFSAPTGSGKTVMMAAVMERLIEGDVTAPPHPTTTFLWITDQPQLNEQTRQRLLSYSTTFGPLQIEIIDTSFDQSALIPGRLYFLNTQKLGKDKTLVTPSDKRTFTIWETLRKTIQERGAELLVIIDEAHRGMDLDEKQQGEARSIVQKFIVGSPGEIDAVPLIVGVTATPKRFNELLEKTNRVVRPITIPADAVRASGLIKDAVRYHIPTESQPADITLLREAARSLKQFRGEWEEYCRASGEPLIRPLLIVQVEDAGKSGYSKTDLAEAAAALSDEMAPLPAEAFAHAFQDQAALSIGNRTVRYLAPSQIEADPHVQVVFFKTSLNTGWDCPRAEVMMSFRRANDATLIAQLVGRMVRAPLARRIEGSELLNRVTLFLPHYNKTGVTSVVTELTSEGGTVPPTELEDARELAQLEAWPAATELIARVNQLPSYTIPRRRSVHDAHRLMRLARVLEDAGIRANARDRAREALLSVLRQETQSRESDPGFRDSLHAGGTLKLSVLTYAADKSEESTVQVAASDENLRDLIDAIGRRTREGLHLAYVKVRSEVDGVEPRVAKLELATLYRDQVAHDKLMRAARQLTTDWFAELAPTFSSLPPTIQARLNEIRASSGSPEIAPILMPVSMSVTVDQPTKALNLPKHLYQDSDGAYPGKLNTWELAVLNDELKRTDIAGWLRNVPRKPWALTVPYEVAQGDYTPVFPDLIVFRKAGNGVVADLLDPHLTEFDDAVPKARGLAAYAEKHGQLFGRIELIQIEKKRIDRLDLTDPDVRNKVKAVASNEHLRQLYELLRKP
jgi:type III restriction enzyme